MNKKVDQQIFIINFQIINRTIMKRFSVLPVTLYRFQETQKPKLRQQSFQYQNGRSSFDFKLGPNNRYNPTVGDIYLGPNGLSLRPLGVNLAQIISELQSKYIYELPKDLIIPDTFVLIHERSDHYSLQTKQSIKPQEFQLKAMKFFQEQKKITMTELRKKVNKHLSK